MPSQKGPKISMYLVFEPVSKNDLDHIDENRINFGRSVRFTHYAKEKSPLHIRVDVRKTDLADGHVSVWFMPARIQEPPRLKEGDSSPLSWSLTLTIILVPSPSLTTKRIDGLNLTTQILPTSIQLGQQAVSTMHTMVGRFDGPILGKRVFKNRESTDILLIERSFPGCRWLYFKSRFSRSYLYGTCLHYSMLFKVHSQTSISTRYCHSKSLHKLAKEDFTQVKKKASRNKDNFGTLSTSNAWKTRISM